MAIIKKFALLFLAVFAVSCCLEQDEPPLPEIYFDFRESSSENNIFSSGQYSLDEVIISSILTANHPFEVNQHTGGTLIIFSVSEENYTINIGDDITLEVTLELAAEDNRCYTTVRIKDVTIQPYGYVASSDVNLTSWSVSVFTN